MEMGEASIGTLISVDDGVVDVDPNTANAPGLLILLTIPLDRVEGCWLPFEGVKDLSIWTRGRLRVAAKFEICSEE
jgi:hypothetical protein